MLKKWTDDVVNENMQTLLWPQLHYSQFKEGGEGFEGVFWQLPYHVAGQIPKMFKWEIWAENKCYIKNTHM